MLGLRWAMGMWRWDELDCAEGLTSMVIDEKRFVNGRLGRYPLDAPTTSILQFHRYRFRHHLRKAINHPSKTKPSIPSEFPQGVLS